MQIFGHAVRTGFMLIEITTCASLFCVRGEMFIEIGLNTYISLFFLGFGLMGQTR